MEGGGRGWEMGGGEEGEMEGGEGGGRWKMCMCM